MSFERRTSISEKFGEVSKLAKLVGMAPDFFARNFDGIADGVRTRRKFQIEFFLHFSYDGSFGENVTRTEDNLQGIFEGPGSWIILDLNASESVPRAE